MSSLTRVSGRISLRGLLLAAAVAVFLLAILFSKSPARDRADARIPQTPFAAVAPVAAKMAPTDEPRTIAAHTDDPAIPRTPRGRPESAFPSVPTILPTGAAPGLEAKTVLSLPWGRYAGAIGLYVPQGEGLPVGPASFAIGPDGRVYVADRVNRRITIFLPDGRIDRTFDVEDNLADLAVDGEGRMHTFDAGTGEVRTLDPRTGAASVSGSVNAMGAGDEPVEGLVVRDGEVFVRRADQTLHAVAGGGAADWTPDRVVTAWPEGGSPAADVTARDASAARRFPVEIETAFLQGSTQYLGADGSGGSYLLVETLGPDGRIDSGVRRYDGEGRLLGAVPVPYKNLAQPERTFTVDAKGGLYQMVTSEEGVRILQWFAND